MTLAMIIFGLLTLVSASGVVAARRPLNSALSLIATLFLLAAQYAMLDAHFVAAVQIMVYAGAIMVLVIFVIMLLGVDNSAPRPSNWGFGVSIVAMIAFAASTLFVIKMGSLKAGVASNNVPENFGSIESIGELLFTKYLYPFEVTSLLLLAAIIGAVVLASETKRALPKGRGLSALRKKESDEGSK